MTTPSAWQDIETAPKDRTLWLVEDGALSGLRVAHQEMGWWVPDKRYEAGGYWQGVSNILAPTHWMPLPDPPEVRHV